MRAVDASEFDRNAGKWRQLGEKEPVAVTKRGRTAMVLVPAADYARLKAGVTVTVY